MDNLIDALETCLEHPLARGETFHVADDEALPVRDLIQAIGRALGKPARLVSIPIAWLKLGALLTGREESVSRLTNPLCLDTRHITTLLGFRPKVSLSEGLARACKP